MSMMKIWINCSMSKIKIWINCGMSKIVYKLILV